MTAYEYDLATPVYDLSGSAEEIIRIARTAVYAEMEDLRNIKIEIVGPFCLNWRY